MLADDILSQTCNIGRIRVHTLPVDPKLVDLDGEMREFEEIMFEAVANIDSQILIENHSGINPENFDYAYEVRSEIRSFNPFILNPQDTSSA